MSTRPNVRYGDPEVALGNEILRTVVGSGVHGIAIAGTDDHDETGGMAVDAKRVPLAILEHWYACGRKIRYATAEVAWQHRDHQQFAHAIAWGWKPTVTRRPYECDRCGWYHLGRPPLDTGLAGWKKRQNQLHNMHKAWNQQARSA